MYPHDCRIPAPRRGCNKPAQGNALGSLVRIFSQALKGRTKEGAFVPPLQGLLVFS